MNTTSRHTLRAQMWLHPRPGLDIDTLAERMGAIPGNSVLELHRACACVGAKVTGHSDDHLLMVDATKET